MRLQSFLMFPRHSGLALITAAMLFAWAGTARALDVDGLSFPDEYVQDGQKLQVNGKGSRLYSWLKVKVYSAVLYTPQRTSDAQALLTARSPRVLYIRMRVDSKRSDAIDAWKYYLEHNCSKPCNVPVSRWTPFLESMADLKEGDTEAYIFTAQGFELLRNDRSVVRLADPDLANLVLAGWLGREPTTPELKAGLLGK